jgi:gluconokinase
MTSHNDDDILLIVAGVSGVGKTTVAEFLASQLKGSRAYSNFVECEIAIKGATYHEADDFHSLENKKLMANGIPLDDERRASWLAAMRDAAKHADEKIVVLACSALKKKYRDVLRECGRKTIFVQLVADPVRDCGTHAQY